MKSSRRAVAILASVLLAMPQRIPAQGQADCSPQIDALRRDLRAFDDVARQMGPGFPRADALEALLGAQGQGGGGDLLNRLTAWNQRIQRFADGVSGYRRCLADGKCDINAYVKAQEVDNKEVADWLKNVGEEGLAKATDTTDRASGPLRDYEAGSGGRTVSSIAKAIGCVTANAQAPPRQAPPRQAPPGRTPPPLPPDTVNQGGLKWDLQIGPCTTGKNPFRFSLCEGRYLRADEVSRQCSPSVVSGVTGGHNASYAFSAGHGQFLPKGLSIDGNGILQGNSCDLINDLIKTGTDLPLCVRQLHVEDCRLFKVGLADAAASPKKGGGSGGKVVGALLVAGGIAGAAVGASALKSASEVSSSSSSGSGSGSGNVRMTYVSSNGISCTFNAGGIISACTSQITVNITGSITSGSTLRLQSSFWGGNQSTTRSPPGSMTFTLSGGTGGTSCPGPLTTLALLNLSQSTSVIIASASGFSIPVSCR